MAKMQLLLHLKSESTYFPVTLFAKLEVRNICDVQQNETLPVVIIVVFPCSDHLNVILMLEETIKDVQGTVGNQPPMYRGHLKTDLLG